MTYYKIQSSNQRIRIGKLVCLARTYREHAREMGVETPQQPLLFLKPESSVIFSNDSIRIPPQSHCLHHEVELGVVIGKEASHVSKENALEYVFGYLVGLDITARDIQTEAKKKGLPWSIAKGFDTFSPISDIVVKETISDPNTLEISLTVNDVVRQHANTNQMVFSVQEIIAFISERMTLKRGDLILTGTPEGVAEIKKGDILKAQLGEYCTLQVTVSEYEDST